MKLENKRINTIALIGIGNIGHRWLESILSMNEDWEVYCVESNHETANALQAEYDGKIEVINSIEHLPHFIDFCAITTTSAVRKQVFDALIKVSEVQNIIFEKFIFQKELDYFDALNTLESKGIKAWVNCTRRESNGYIELKERLRKANSFTCYIEGADWGLACNGIHFIDLIKFLGDGKEIYVDTSKLSPPIIESKRRGYLEFFGSIMGYSGKCKTFEINCKQEGKMSEIGVMIYSDIGIYHINESRKIVCFCEKNDDWIWREKPFELPYTSQVMGRIIKEILDKERCILTTYKESMEMHLMYMHGVNHFLRNNYNWGEEICPIT